VRLYSEILGIDYTTQLDVTPKPEPDEPPKNPKKGN
jgi:hypothetical protein